MRAIQESDLETNTKLILKTNEQETIIQNLEAEIASLKVTQVTHGKSSDEKAVAKPREYHHEPSALDEKTKGLEKGLKEKKEYK